jgi:CheY-like chemotaxis protein
MDRILLVDDHAELGYAAKLWLSMRGFDVTIATSGGQALELIGLYCFDVIICDIGLPDMSGVALMGLIRGRCDTPAIAFTAYHNLTEMYVEAATLFVAHLKKPVDPEHMEATVRSVLAARPT